MSRGSEQGRTLKNKVYLLEVCTTHAAKLTPPSSQKSAGAAYDSLLFSCLRALACFASNHAFRDVSTPMFRSATGYLRFLPPCSMRVCGNSFILFGLVRPLQHANQQALPVSRTCSRSKVEAQQRIQNSDGEPEQDVDCHESPSVRSRTAKIPGAHITEIFQYVSRRY